MATLDQGMPPGSKGAYVCLAVGVFAISWSAILVRYAGVPGLVSAFWRVALAAAILSMWSLAARPKWLNWKQMCWAGVGGVFFAADLALFNTAATHANAANVTAIGNNTPIFAGLLSWMIWRRRPSARLWIGLGFTVIGTAVLAGGDALLSAQFEAADLMALAASLCFAVYLLATERVRSETETLPFLTTALVASSAALLVFNAFAGFRLPVSGARSWAAVIGLALVPQLAGYLAITYALGHLSATTVSIGLTAQIPGTAILAWILLHERLLPHQAIGGVLILIAIWITLGPKSSDAKTG